MPIPPFPSRFRVQRCPVHHQVLFAPGYHLTAQLCSSALNPQSLGLRTSAASDPLIYRAASPSPPMPVSCSFQIYGPCPRRPAQSARLFRSPGTRCLQSLSMSYGLRATFAAAGEETVRESMLGGLQVVREREKGPREGYLIRIRKGQARE